MYVTHGQAVNVGGYIDSVVERPDDPAASQRQTSRETREIQRRGLRRAGGDHPVGKFHLRGGGCRRDGPHPLFHRAGVLSVATSQRHLLVAISALERRGRMSATCGTRRGQTDGERRSGRVRRVTRTRGIDVELELDAHGLGVFSGYFDVALPVERDAGPGHVESAR